MCRSLFRLGTSARCAPSIPLSSSTHRLEELELQVQVAHQVNAHLNAEVERMTAAVEALQAERSAFQRHIKDLAAKLAAARAALPEAQAAAQAEADAEAAEEAEAAEGQGELVSDRFPVELPSSQEPAADGTGSTDVGGDSSNAAGAAARASESQPWLQDGAWQRLQAAGRRQSWLVAPEEILLGEVIGKGTFGEPARFCCALPTPDAVSSWMAGPYSASAGMLGLHAC